MSAMDPNAEERMWSGTVELDCGDLGAWEVDVEIMYAHDGNNWGLVGYKASAYCVTPKGDTVEVDLTDSITESAIDQIMEDHIVS